jgi:pimeloyl-ACP methyl ester carboxylesterase
MRWSHSAPLGLLAAAGGTVLFTARRWVTPVRDRTLPDPPNIDPEEVEFRSRDGTRLFGVFMRGREGYPGVVFCHGYYRSLAEPYEIGVCMRQEGYNVLLFDFRGCGHSDGRLTTLGYKEAWDVLAATRFLRAHLQNRRVGVLGISMGAAAAILAAAESSDIAALVLDSPYAHLRGVVRKKIPDFAPLRWLVPLGWLSVIVGHAISGGRMNRARPVDHVAKIAPRPLLFIWGERDSYIPEGQPEELFNAAGEPKERWIAPGSGHAQARIDHRAEYVRRVERFFDRHLRGP